MIETIVVKLTYYIHKTFKSKTMADVIRIDLDNC